MRVGYHLFRLLVIAVWYMIVMMPALASAEVSGYMDLIYTTQESNLKEASGTSTDLKTRDFRQQYSLTLIRDIYPNLRFTASGFFEKEKINTEVNDLETDSTLTTVRPLLDLTLNTPLVVTGGTYNRREQTLKTSGAPTVTLVNDSYIASLLYRPEGLPSLDGHVERAFTFDKDRTTLDLTKDFATLSVKYSPTPGLNLEYRPTYSRDENNLNNLQVTDRSHTGKADFAGLFFDGRVSVYGRIDVTRDEMETVAGGTGEVSLQITPFRGLTAIDDTPLEGSLDSNPALIDGNVLLGAGINLGLPPPGADTKERNIGLDFFNDTEVTRLLVWVDRELPERVASTFTWDIYVSSDNLRWSLLARLPSAPFGPFDNRFELRFDAVTTRYIKVVTRPLSPVVPEAVNFPIISVTEMQAFSTRPVQDVRGKLTRTSQFYDLGAKVRILDSPALFYELAYTSAKTDPSKRSTLSNGLFATQRFSRIFSGQVRVAREDNEEPLGNGTAYVYNASLLAAPLRTLSHTLTFSGRYEDFAGRHADRNSVYLYNIAELYRGVSLNLGGGIDFVTLDTGQKETDTLLTVGLSAVPHRTISLNFYYNDSTSRPSGGNGEDNRTKKFTRRTDLIVAYNPFASIYLFADLAYLNQETGNRTLRNIGLNWSPFQDGLLLFNFYYNEDFDSQENSTIRTIRPSLRLKLSGKSYIDISYLSVKTDSDLQNQSTNSISANLRVAF